MFQRAYKVYFSLTIILLMPRNSGHPFTGSVLERKHENNVLHFGGIGISLSLLIMYIRQFRRGVKGH